MQYQSSIRKITFKKFCCEGNGSHKRFLMFQDWEPTVIPLGWKKRQNLDNLILDAINKSEHAKQQDCETLKQ